MRLFITKQLIKISRIMGLKNLQSLLDVLILNEHKERKKKHPNPFVNYGKKCFSQTDEDGITLEIVNRLGITKGIFMEFGVGNGMENNTLVLLSLGWSGYWFGGQDLDFNSDNSEKLTFKKAWITKENIVELCKNASTQHSNIDLISLDLDGNDYHLIKEMLQNNVLPTVFIVEYNAKFFPPIEFIIEYKEDHKWNNDDYFGASLTSFYNLFKEFNYSLVCCNSASGSNAFFIKKEFMNLFPEVPSSINDIYCSPFYFRPSKNGHTQSIKTIKKIINN